MTPSTPPDPQLALAMQHHQQGRHNDAFVLYRAASQRIPRDPRVWAGLGLLMHQHGAHADALEHFGRSLALDPRQASVWINSSLAARQLGQLARAEQCLRTALGLPDQKIAAHTNLGLVLHAQGRLEESEQHLREAIRLAPQGRHAPAWANLSNTLRDQLRFAEAEDALRQALAIEPSSPAIRSNLLFLLGYRRALSAGERFAEARAWQRHHPYQVAQPPAPVLPPLGGRRLRVGYVSSDLRRHSVAAFIEPVLASHDHAAVDLRVYASVARPDEATERLKRRVPQWHSIYSLTDDQAAELIRSHGIDVLVDLGGHTSGNRLGVFLRRPAPAQVCWMGYFATTGITAMDYWITDDFLHPEGHDELFTERLWPLPGCWLTYQPPADAPVPTAQSGAGELCFGSFNQLLKVSDETVDLWSALLCAVPSSRLLLKAKSLLDRDARARLVERFANQGVAAERLELLPPVTSSAEHLAVYGRVDVALDTTPFTGGTTTCEALWMGVPVLTLLGNTMPGRMSASLLRAADLTEGIAVDRADFVAKGRAWAEALTPLSTPERTARRQDQRNRMARSRLLDHAAFTRRLEDAFRSMLAERLG